MKFQSLLNSVSHRSLTTLTFFDLIFLVFLRIRCESITPVGGLGHLGTPPRVCSRSRLTGRFPFASHLTEILFNSRSGLRDFLASGVRLAACTTLAHNSPRLGIQIIAFRRPPVAVCTRCEAGESECTSTYVQWENTLYITYQIGHENNICESA